MNYGFNINLNGNVLAVLTQWQSSFGNLSGTIDRFAGMAQSRAQGIAARFRGAFGSATQSVEELRKKMDQLKGKRNLLVDTRHIKAANREIDQLEAKIKHLEGMGVTPGKDKAGGGGGLWGMARGALPALGVAGLIAGAGSFAQAGMDRQQTQVAFEQFVGKEGVKPLMGQMNRFADVTPYSNEDVYGAGRNLLAARVSTGDLNQKMTNIGNLSAVSQKDFGETARAYAMAKQRGVVGNDLLSNQFSGTAVSEQLQKNLGVNGDQLFKMAEQRKVRFSDLDKALSDLSAKGGLYEGGLDKLSATAGGKLSTFMGTMGNKIAEWAASQNSVFGSIFDVGSEFLAKMQPIEDAFGRLIQAFAPLKESFTGLLVSFGLIGDKGLQVQGIIDLIAGTINILATAISVITSPVGQLILLFMGLAKAALLLNAYLFVTNAEGVVPLIATFQKLWAVVLANPFGLAIAALVAVGTALKWAWDNVDGFREGLIKVWEVAKSVFSGISNMWQAFKSGDFEGLKKAFNTSWQEGMAKAEVSIKADRTARAVATKAPAVGNAGGPKATPATDGKKGTDGGVGKAAGLNATTGGTKSTTITINLKSLVEKLEVHAGTVGEGLDDIEDRVIDVMLRVVNSANALNT